MDSYIYLDQNTLSDLRERKLIESSDASLRKLKELCRKDSCRLVYSDTHLDEINQISKEEYKLEHIELLAELKAAYITPITTELNAKDAHLVWQGYLRNQSDNDSNGINKVTVLFDMVNRKFTGLPVEESFEELNFQLKDALTKMLKINVQKLIDLDPNELLEGGADAIREANEKMATQLKSITEMIAFDISDEHKLGPKPLRDFDRLKALDLENMDDSLVIDAIDKLFNSENGDFSWSDYFDNTNHNQIARCYTLMVSV